MNQSQEELKLELIFSKAVFEIAKNFATSDNIDIILNNALKNLGEACNAGRAYIFLFTENGDMDNTHEWCAEGVSPEIENLKNLPLAMFPWWIKKLEQKEIIDVESVDAMSEDAEAERNILQQQNIKSVLVLGLYTEQLIGFVGIDNVATEGTWEKSALGYVKVASEIMSSAILREEKKKYILNQNKELIETNQKLNQALNQLVQNEKMMAIGQLAAGISHEINNPMGFINSNIKMLKKYFQIYEKYIEILKRSPSEALEFAEKNKIEYILSDLNDIFEETEIGIERVIRIVKYLKIFSTTDEDFIREDFNINKSITSILGILNKDIKIVTEFNSNGHFECNDSMINQALFNIIINSVQAVKSKFDKLGEIDKALVEIKTYDENSNLVILISDNGNGITDKNKLRIFDPFFTTKGTGKGTGLGLYISYDIIVNKNNGKIIVNTELDEGTEFRIILPKDKT